MSANKKDNAEQVENTAADTSTNAEKTVTIRIPRTKENSGDVFVSVNDRTWLIQRGVSVEVPECVAEVLRHQEEMLEEAYIYEDMVSQKE